MGTYGTLLKSFDLHFIAGFLVTWEQKKFLYGHVSGVKAAM